MKKNNLIKKIILLSLVMFITCTNFFAIAADNTNQDGSINFESTSQNYRFKAEVGIPASPHLVSSNYILTSKPYLDQDSSSVPATETYGGGLISFTNTSYIKTSPESDLNSLDVDSSTESTTKPSEYNCDSFIDCASEKIIKKIDSISKNLNDKSDSVTDSDKVVKTLENTIPKKTNPTLIIFLLILIIIILYFTYKRIKNNLNQGRIESKNKYD